MALTKNNIVRDIFTQGFSTHISSAIRGFFDFSESSGDFLMTTPIPEFDGNALISLTPVGGVSRQAADPLLPVAFLGNEVQLDGVSGSRLDVTFTETSNVNNDKLFSVIVKLDDLLTVQPIFSFTGASSATLGVYIDTDGVLKHVYFDGVSTYTPLSVPANVAVPIVAGAYFYISATITDDTNQVRFSVISLESSKSSRFTDNWGMSAGGILGTDWGSDVTLAAIGEHTADYGTGVATESFKGRISAFMVSELADNGSTFNDATDNRTLKALMGAVSISDFDYEEQLGQELGGSLVYDYNLEPYIPHTGSNPTNAHALEKISGDSWLFTAIPVSYNYANNSQLLAPKRQAYIASNTTAVINNVTKTNLATLTTNWIAQVGLDSQTPHNDSALEDFGILRFEDDTGLKYIILEVRGGSLYLRVKDAGAEESFGGFSLGTVKGINQFVASIYVRDGTNIRVLISTPGRSSTWVSRYILLNGALTADYKLVSIGTTGVIDSGILNTPATQELAIVSPRVWDLTTPLTLKQQYDLAMAYSGGKPDAGRYIYKNNYTIPNPIISDTERYPFIPLSGLQLIALPNLGKFDSLRFTKDDGTNVEVFEVLRIESNGIYLRRGLEGTTPVAWVAGDLENRLTDEALNKLIRSHVRTEAAARDSSLVMHINQKIGTPLDEASESFPSVNYSKTGATLNASSGTDNVGRNNVSLGRNLSVMGDDSVVIGGNNISYGGYNVCIGLNNSTFGGVSGYGVAIGHNNENKAGYSTSLGYGNNCTASDTANKSGGVAIGYNNTANGTNGSDYGVAIGYSNYASGQSSVSIGDDTGSYAYATVAIGTNTYVHDKGGIGIGYDNYCKGIYSITIGYDNYSNGKSNILIGYDNYISSGYTYSVVIGHDNYCYGSRSVLIGKENYAGEEGDYNVLIGHQNYVGGGEYNISIGYGNSTSSSYYFVAIGYNIDNTGDEAVAIGFQCTASGTRGISIGNASTANPANAIALGELAGGNGIRGISIGRDSGSIGQDSISIGSTSVTNATNAIGVGTNSNAAGSHSVAIGAESYGGSYGAVSIGYSSYAAGNNNVAIGYGAYTLNADATAIGSNANAVPARSIALGKDAKAEGIGIINIAAAPAIRLAAINEFTGSELEKLSGAEAVITQEVLDAKTVATYSLVLPTGYVFIPTKLILLATNIVGLTVQPTVSFGAAGALVAAAITTALTANNKYQAFEAPFADDVTAQSTLTFDITIVATGTTVEVKPVWVGTLIKTS